MDGHAKYYCYLFVFIGVIVFEGSAPTLHDQISFDAFLQTLL